jgi:hypothetical protein
MKRRRNNITIFIATGLSNRTGGLGGFDLYFVGIENE